MANNNFRIESQKFFNAQTGQNHRSWARAAAAYYRQVGSSTKQSLPEAMATYFGKVNSGTIGVPTAVAANQAVATDGQSVQIRGNSGSPTYLSNATLALNAGGVSSARLPTTATVIQSAGTTNVPITFTTARTAGATATAVATYTVVNGVITAITIA